MSTTKLNFRIHPAHAPGSYDQVMTFEVTPIQSASSFPPSTPPSTSKRPRTASSASYGAGGSNCYSYKRDNDGNNKNNHNTPVAEIEMRSRGGSSDDGYWSNSRPHRHHRNAATTATSTRQSLPEQHIFSSSYSVSSSSSSQDANNEEEMKDDEDDDEAYSTNERLLVIAFVSFMSFSITQMYFAFRAESEAMKGDSAAMIVDSFTYLFNWFAERRKRTFDQYYMEPTALAFTPDRARLVRQRTKRKVVLQYEILPPLLSVSTLVVVTAVVLRDALRVIWLDLHRDPALQSDPNIHLMMMFSMINLCLDGMNFVCFARGGHLFGYDTTEDERDRTAAQQSRRQPQLLPLHDYFNTEEEEEEPGLLNMTASHRHHRRQQHQQHANLNMVGLTRVDFVFLMVNRRMISSRWVRSLTIPWISALPIRMSLPIHSAAWP